MIRIYIGIEDGVIGAVYSTCHAEVILVDTDRQSNPEVIFSEFKSQKISHRLIKGFRNEAIKEYKNYELEEK